MNLTAFDQHEIDELETTDKLNHSEGWAIESLESANWALRKISALQKKIDETKQLASSEKERIEKWEHQEITSDEQSIVFFEEKLGQYLRVLRKFEPKLRIKTPYGVVSTRKINPKINYDDQIIEELKEKGLVDYVNIKEDVNRAELKKILTVANDGQVITEDGELLEHASVEPGYDKIVVRTVN